MLALLLNRLLSLSVMDSNVADDAADKVLALLLKRFFNLFVIACVFRDFNTREAKTLLAKRRRKRRTTPRSSVNFCCWNNTWRNGFGFCIVFDLLQKNQRLG